MTTKLRIPRFALALALALALLASIPMYAQAGVSNRDTGSLVGVWRMTSLELGTPGDLQPVPYTGQVIFTKSGTMSVQAMHPDPDAPDTTYQKDGYEAYYGTFTPNRAAGTFVVTVESSLTRDLIGQSMTRNFRVTGDTLVLTPPDPAEGWRASYQRV